MEQNTLMFIFFALVALTALSLSIYATVEMHSDTHKASARNAVDHGRILGQANATHLNEQGVSVGSKVVEGLTFRGQEYVTIMHISVPNITAGTVVDLRGIKVKFLCDGPTWTNDTTTPFPGFTVSNLFGSTFTGSTSPATGSTNFSTFVVDFKLEDTYVHQGNMSVNVNGITSYPIQTSGTVPWSGEYSFDVNGYVWPSNKTSIAVKIAFMTFAGQIITAGATQAGKVDVCNSNIIDIIQNCSAM